MELPSEQRTLRPLYLAQNLTDLNKLATKQSYGRKLNVLYRASDNLAKNVFDMSKKLPLDEEKIYILCLRYVHLLNMIRSLQQDERFFSSRFKSVLKRIEELKEETHKSLTRRYECESPVKANEQDLSGDMPEGESIEKTSKSPIINDDDVFITPRQLYRLTMENTVKTLIMDARPSSEYEQCALKFATNVNIPEEVISKGLSTNTLQQKLNTATTTIFQTRHNFDYIILTDLETNKISYNATKLHDLRTILVDWDQEQRYQTLPLVLEGGIKALVDVYPTMVTNPGAVFNQLFHQFDDFIQDDIEYPDIASEAPRVPSPVYHQPNEEAEATVFADDEMEFNEPPPPAMEVKTHGHEQPAVNALAQRLLSISEQQVQLEEKLLQYAKERCDMKKALNSGHVNHDECEYRMKGLERRMSVASSQRLELEERHRLAKEDFNEKCASMDVSHLNYIINDILALEKKRLSRYQQRKLVESDETAASAEKIYKGDGYVKPKPTSVVPSVPIADRSKKPHNANTLDLELNALMAIDANTGVTGLVNIKNTCYMNSLIQCLRFCPSFAYFFSKHTFRATLPVASALSDLLKSMWSQNHIALRPARFYDVVCALPAHDYSTGDHEDIHEFFVNVTEALHKELGESLETSGDCTSYLGDWHKAFKSKISIVNRAFFYQLEVRTTCPRCQACIVKYEYNNNVFLSMEYDQLRAINVQAEVDRVMHPSRDPDAQKYCSKCETVMAVRHEIRYYPSVLVVNLMRYTYSIKDRCVLRLLNEAVFPQELRFGKAGYNLCAVACHSGNRDRGHYTACCYHPGARRWIEYNDESWSTANIDDTAYRVRAYMLFYTLAPRCDGINQHYFQAQ